MDEGRMYTPSHSAQRAYHRREMSCSLPSHSRREMLMKHRSSRSRSSYQREKDRSRQRQSHFLHCPVYHFDLRRSRHGLRQSQDRYLRLRYQCYFVTRACSGSEHLDHLGFQDCSGYQCLQDCERSRFQHYWIPRRCW